MAGERTGARFVRSEESFPVALVKGVAAGAVGGMVAGWVMERFQAAARAASRAEVQEQPPQQQLAAVSGEPATVQTARRVSARFGHELADDELPLAAPIVHYGFSAGMGALYGGLSEMVGAVSAQSGMLFGIALWLGADEIAVPALGLSRSPLKYPASTHGEAILSHLVWAATTDTVRRFLRFF
jgi:putative membrane protein